MAWNALLSKSHRNGFLRRQQLTPADPSKQHPAFPRAPEGEIGNSEGLAFIRPDTLRGKAAGLGQVSRIVQLYEQSLTPLPRGSRSAQCREMQ